MDTSAHGLCKPTKPYRQGRTKQDARGKALILFNPMWQRASGWRSAAGANRSESPKGKTSRAGTTLQAPALCARVLELIAQTGLAAVPIYYALKLTDSRCVKE